MKKKRILIIHHRSQYGGAPRSLIENLNILKKNKKLEIDIICPYGEVYNRLKKKKFKLIGTKGVPIFDNSNYGYYEKFRWLVLIREIYFLFCFIRTLNKIDKIYDIIHLNEILCFPILRILKKKFFCKIIIHQRTRLKKINSLRINWMNNMLRKYVYKIIVIDKECQKSLNSSLKKKSCIILNSVSEKIILKNKKIKTNKKIVFGFVGQLHESKGIKKLVLCFKKYCKDKNIELRIFSPFPEFKIKNLLLNFFKIRKDFYFFYKSEELHKYSNIKFMGYQTNLNKLYKNMDVLVFPNEDYAIGRPVFESAFFGIPSIIAYKHKISEYLIHGKTGYTIYPNTPNNIYKRIVKITDNKIIYKMGIKAAKLCSKNFSAKKNTDKIIKLYFS